MKIVSWNVAGIRAMLKKGHLDKLIAENDFDMYYFHVVKICDGKKIFPIVFSV